MLSDIIFIHPSLVGLVGAVPVNNSGESNNQALMLWTDLPRSQAYREV